MPLIISDQWQKNIMIQTYKMEVVMTKTEQEKLQIIKEVNATMRMENMPLTNEDKQRLKDIADGKTTVNEAINKIIKEYKE